MCRCVWVHGDAHTWRWCVCVCVDGWVGVEAQAGSHRGCIGACKCVQHKEIYVNNHASHSLLSASAEGSVPNGNTKVRLGISEGCSEAPKEGCLGVSQDVTVTCFFAAASL